MAATLVRAAEHSSQHLALLCCMQAGPLPSLGAAGWSPPSALPLSAMQPPGGEQAHLGMEQPAAATALPSLPLSPLPPPALHFPGVERMSVVAEEGPEDVERPGSGSPRALPALAPLPSPAQPPRHSWLHPNEGTAGSGTAISQHGALDRSGALGGAANLAAERQCGASIGRISLPEHMLRSLVSSVLAGGPVAEPGARPGRLPGSPRTDCAHARQCSTLQPVSAMLHVPCLHPCSVRMMHPSCTPC